MPHAHFRCIRGCDGTYALSEVLYRCPSCGDLLEVEHDLEELQKTPPLRWKALFAERWGGARYPWTSGVWGKKEWVAPHVRDENIVSMVEGATALLPSPALAHQIGAHEVFIKQCGTSHTGSFKDLGMTVLVSSVAQMIADGVAIPAIACASTGDTSAALAAYAARAGIRAVVILPAGKISAAQLVQPLASGAQVLALDTDFDGCMEIVQKLAERDGVYLANSMNSLRLEGQKTVAIEIAQQLSWSAPDWVVIPGGNLGNVSALAAGFRMMSALGVVEGAPRLCVAQAEAANPLARAYRDGFENFAPVVAKPTAASAIQIGNPVSRDRAIRALREFDGVALEASEGELAEAAARADRAGLYVCPHTAVALAATEKLAASGEIEPGHRVVVVSTASGLKFSEFKAAYHRGDLRGAEQPSLANQPVELTADYEVVRGAVLRGIEQR